MEIDNLQSYTFFEQKVIKFDKALSLVENIVGVTCFVVMGFFIGFSIISRVLLHIPIIWIEETSRHLMVIGIYVGLAIVTRERAHLNLSILSNLLPKKGGKVIEFIGDLLLLITFITLIFICASYTKQTMNFGQRSPALRYPMWYMYASITFCFFLSAVRQFMVIWNYYFSKNKILSMQKDEITIT